MTIEIPGVTQTIELQGEKYELIEVGWNDPLCVEMRTRQRAEIAETYPQYAEPGTKPSESDCLVFYVLTTRTSSNERQPLAAGGLRRVDDARVEVKRMFVVPEARGRGKGASAGANLGQVVLTLLEQRAKSMHFRTLLLETGTYMDRARRFYERSGFEETHAYPPYEDDAPDSVFYAKAIQ